MADAQAKACPVPGEFGEPFVVLRADDEPETFVGNVVAYDGCGTTVVATDGRFRDRRTLERAVACVNALAGLDPEALPRFLEAAACLAGVIEDGEYVGGVAGYHLNGDLASWAEVGGDEFCEALARLRREVASASCDTCVHLRSSLSTPHCDRVGIDVASPATSGCDLHREVTP